MKMAAWLGWVRSTLCPTQTVTVQTGPGNRLQVHSGSEWWESLQNYYWTTSTADLSTATPL